MSVNGVRGPYNTSAPPPRPATSRGTDAPAAPATAAAARTARPATAPASVTAPATVTPPPGTDPELWTVLTPDERAYFARLGAMGPLTYGRVLSAQTPPASPASRGVRLDVKA